MTKKDIKRLALARHTADTILSVIPAKHQDTIVIATRRRWEEFQDVIGDTYWKEFAKEVVDLECKRK